MDRFRVWPLFRDEWILYEDADVLAVDKPAGISCQAADAQRPDDIVTRLKQFLGRRGDSTYLGIHQRLDRDTSGLFVLTRRREVNTHLATQFETRTAAKTYVACVTGWPSEKNAAILRHTLAPLHDGRAHVVARSRPGAKDAVTRVRTLARKGDRVMLELSLETGRMHQARAQLAHAGAPIAGDELYGGTPAPRLLLHSSKLAFEHPGSRRKLCLSSPLPADFGTWLERGDLGEAVFDDDAALSRALALAVERRWGLGHDPSTNAFRLINEDGDGLPNLAVDVYDRWIVAQLHAGEGRWAEPALRERVLDRLVALGFDGVYLKVRPRQANLIADTRREDVAPRLPVRGTAAPEEVPIVEEGTPFLVRLGDGLSTGLFVDQRANRKRVRAIASGTAVANLFAYTCAFTVAAALGRARRTVSVDASAAALERGRANLAHAGVLEGHDHSFVADDAFAWLGRAARRGERFDLVLLDPPSYSTTRRGRFVAVEDYANLAAAAVGLLTPGGRLLACTNHRGITQVHFRRMLFDACRSAKRPVAQVKDLGAPPDFPVGAGGVPFMKSALVTLGP